MRKLLLIFLTLSFSAFADTEFKIITLQHRFASDLLPIIEPMVGVDGAATGMNNQLILRANPDRMREIEETVSKLDAARVNRKISVKTSNSMQSQREQVEASGTARVGKVTVSNDTHAKPNSGRVEVESSGRSSSQKANQFINVLDGERAFIRVGQIVPFTSEWITLTRRYIHIERTTDWREIRTGFAVRPHTIGNQVELEITPRIARPNSQGFVDFEELTTVVRVALGNWVDIAGTMQTNDEVSRKILGMQSNASQQNSSLMVKVD
jgi:hypothetical protein